MILLHILSNEEDQANDIVDFLTEENLILEAVLLEKVSVRKKEGNSNQTLIMGKTKALLFNTIDIMLKEKYKEKMPVIYSLPIVNMDWEQSKNLTEDIRKV